MPCAASGQGDGGRARASGCSAATRPSVGGPTAPPTPQAARLAPCP